ncbi:MAG: SDR family oxidoreductase [Rhizobiales bacterium]|nr:SDR family oxidoreductase [Hyphomicrobiales bacterium]
MASEMKRFVGKSAVVTGGASGIGLAIAERLRKEGARVCVWDRDNAPSDSLAGASEIQSIQLDITDHAAVAAAAKQTVAFFGAIDVLVCSAGVAGANATTWDYSIEEWKKVFDINVHGLFFCNRAVVPHMMERNYGRIVNIASIAGKEGNPNASAYSASKAAVIGLTKSLGKELAKTGITVNSVTPAAVRTPIFDQITEEHIQFMLSKIPMGRLGKVEEVAALVCWLASEECSFTTGAVFDVSGGRAVY